MDQQNNTISVTPVTAPRMRPGIITFFCILGFIGAAITAAILMISASASNPTTWLGTLIITSLVIILEVVGLIGYWRMRKWGVYVYTAVQIFYAIYSGFDFAGFTIPILTVLAGLANIRKMS